MVSSSNEGGRYWTHTDHSDGYPYPLFVDTGDSQPAMSSLDKTISQKLNKSRKRRNVLEHRAYLVVLDVHQTS